MIHHLSLPAAQPRHVAQVLAELLGGGCTPFGPYPGAYVAWAGDAHGTAIEIFPAGTEMTPDPALGHTAFRHNPQAPRHIATHAAISVAHDAAVILAIAAREGWQARELSRGAFRVIEFWLENSVMLELLTPAMAAEYLRVTRRPR